MSNLQDEPNTTPWPTGGTLGSIPNTTLYGDGGTALDQQDESTPWPPSFSGGGIVTKYGLLLIVYGGTAGNLSGNTMSVVWDFMDISPFKLNDGGTLLASIRAAHPGCKVLLYKAIAEMEIAPANTASAIRFSQTPIVYNEAVAHDAGSASNDKWILRDGSNNPVLAYGYTTTYGADLGLTSLRDRLISNLTDACSVLGVDGIWFDNVLAQRPNTNTKYATDDAWENAVIANIKAVGDALRTAGLVVYGNAFKYRGGDGRSDDATFIKEWWDRIGGSFDAKMNEGWMATAADRARVRKDQAGWQDYYRNYADLVVHEQSVNGRGANPAQTVPGTSATYMEQLIYGRAAFLLGWDGIHGSYAPFVQGGDSLHVNYTFDVGAPLAAQVEIQSGVFRRYYQKALVVLNAHPTNSYSIPSSPDGRVYTDASGTPVTYPLAVASGRAKVLKTASGGGGGGGSLPKADTLTDNFDDNSIGSQWTIVAPSPVSVSESSAKLNIVIPLNAGSGKYGGLTLAQHVDLSASKVHAQLDPGSITDVNQEVNFIFHIDASNALGFAVVWSSGLSARVLRPYKKVAGVQTTLATVNPYTPASTHAWLRIIESVAGTILWQTSPDGTTWTTQATQSSGLPTYTDGVVKLEAGHDSATVPAIAATFDNFNTLPVTTYSAEILAESSLVAYYRLGETAGATQVLDSKGTRHSTTVAAGVTLGASGLITGDADTAASFSGAGSGGFGTGYIVLPSPGIASGAWSVEAWVNETGPGSIGATDHAALFGNGYGQRLLYRTSTISPDAGPRMLAQFGGINMYTPTTLNIALGTRHHVVLVYDPTLAKQLLLYIDGALAVDATVSSAPNWLNAAWWLGSYNGDLDNYMLNGKLDEVAVYNAALTLAKIQSHYANGIA